MENIVGVVRGLRGRTADVIYDLFFGEKRVVAAIVLHFSDLTDLYNKISPMTFLFGNLLEHGEVKVRSMKLIEERRLAFKDKNLDEILASHRANIEIVYESVVSVTIKKGLVQKSLQFVVQGDPESKVNFWLEEGQIAEVEGLIEKILPSKIR